MKTAKEWAMELWDVEQSCGMNQQHENEAFVAQIQLDAIKEGMLRAALIVQLSTVDATTYECGLVLKAVEQLTERDL